ncbi:hypothetical protein AB0I37_24960 [Micromonospora purpureochromogenes]|uniref:hypothetical protein n=1 Tax=Micromonospora purpureochromogenes TaxID=47872 RepID=UPI0033EC5714
MGVTDAERQRRYRAHKRGDHSLCGLTRDCSTATVTVTPPVTAVTRDAESRGARIWREEGGAALTGARRALLEEACRLADRLDRLDAILAGDRGEWMRFQVSEDGADVTVTLDKALAEARQQAVALKQLVGELRQGGAVDKPATGGSVLDQLAARRAQRLANPAG